jgi:acetylornithine/N-succinyldiaminopimelate aminotransferase
LRERCGGTGALLIFDEVQTGFGRVGDWFAANRYGVVPDVITAAKAMGGGLPLAGVFAPRDVLRRFAADPPFSHITTFGGHPISCAAGAAAVGVIHSEGLLSHAEAMGQFLLDGLRGLVCENGPVAAVRGAGLMIGVEPRSEPIARQIVDGCKADGLILETTLLDGRVVRFSPPLVVTRDQCAQALDTYRQVLGRVEL